MAKNTLEVLTAEMLGDVGKLHDQIEALPARLDETIQPTLKRAEEVLPYLLDIKRKELDEAAARILAASDALEEKRRELAETLQQDVDNELRARVEDYTSQVMAATKIMIEQTVQSEMTQAAVTIQTAAQELDHARQGLRRSQLQDMFWMTAVGVIGGISALLFYVTLFQ
jgi:exonuclease VII large subunit